MEKNSAAKNAIDNINDVPKLPISTFIFYMSSYSKKGSNINNYCETKYYGTKIIL